MYTLKSSILINRPQQEVFDFMSNPANFRQWQNGVESAERLSEPDVGSTVKVVRNFLGRKVESTFEYTAWNPPKMVSAKTTSGPAMELTTKWEAQGDGTLVNTTLQAELGGIFKLAEGMVGKQLEKQIAADNDALKMLLEANGA